MKVDIEELADALDVAQPSTDDERRVMVTLYEMLARGTAVVVDELAERASLDPAGVQRTLDDWPNLFRDEEGRIIAFGGLALSATAHAFDVEGRRLYTWCGFDPLFIAPLLGVGARVTSTCPVTDRAITLTVGPDGIEDVDPLGAVLSFLRPSDIGGGDVIERFCHYVRLFASEEAAASWTADHPGTFILGLDDAFELGRRTFGVLKGA